MIQLKQILEDLKLEIQAPAQEVQPAKLNIEQKKKLSEMVSRYNEYGKSVYREAKIIDVAKNLQEIADLAEKYAIQECSEWIEGNTVKRNMSELKKYNENFGKLAQEVHSKQQQLEALYEDMGRILGRYFHVNEQLDSIKKQ